MGLTRQIAAVTAALLSFPAGAVSLSASGGAMLRGHSTPASPPYATGTGIDCPAGYETISDLVTCVKAANDLFSTEPTLYTDSAYPLGCFVTLTLPGFNVGDVRRSTNGTVSADVICKSTAPGSYGDPHLGNLKGEKFDVRMPGNHTYLVIPRGAAEKTALLHVVAEIESLGPVCNGLLFVTGLKFAGKWLGEVQSVRFSTSVSADMDVKALKIKMGSSSGDVSAADFAALAPAGLVQVTEFKPKKPERLNQHVTTVLFKLKLGPSIAKVRMVYQKEKETFSNSLWLTSTGLQGVEGEIGGILGLDDHALATRVPEQCKEAGSKMILVHHGSGTVHAMAALGDIAEVEES